MTNLTESAHPSVERLRTFGLGQLNEAEASAIEEHVSHCEPCCRTLADVRSDTFVDVLRSSIQATPANPATEAQTQAPDSPTALPPLGLPPELSDHPRYRVLALLGAGGMGAVYKAEHRLMERVVALKVMNRAVVGSAATVERFRREFRASALLSHPNIVPGYDAEQAGDVHFLVMEYVEGTDLARWVAERGPLPVTEACDYIRQAARGLQHAHEHGMIHRDIKPHNLMRTLDGTIKILDFGLARLVAEASSGQGGVTGQGTLLGTVDYLAPEQADDARQADIRSDIYSLGCTLYHLLTGRPPFPKGTIVQKIMAHTEREPESLEELRPDLPPGLARVVQRMMAKSPKDRYQTPAEVDDALAAFAGQTVVLDPGLKRRAAGAKKAGGARRRWSIAVAALLLALVGIGGAVVYRIQTDNGELVITTDNADVEVVIKQNGKLVRIIDTKTNKEIKLDSGLYELELGGKAEGLTLSPDKVTIFRGKTALATVERRRPAPELPQESSVLFNGKDLTGWVVDGGNDKVWRVENGELVGKHVDQIGYDPCWLLTEQSYSDFRLQLEFKLSSGTNSGVALRAVPGEKGRVDKTKPLHAEVQILDDAKYRRPDGKVDSPTGSLFWNSGATYLGPEQPADLKPIGDWNEMVIESRGDTLQVWVNGRRIQNADLHKLAGQSDALPGLKRPSGRIGLQQHTGEVRFRNVEIRGLPDPPEKKVGEVRELTWPGGKENVYYADFSPDGRYLLAGGDLWSGGTAIWDTATRDIVLVTRVDLSAGAVFLPDNKHILGCGQDGQLAVWDHIAFKETRRFEAHRSSQWPSISADGTRAVSYGSEAGAPMVLWDVTTGKPLAELNAGHDGIFFARISPDGKRIATVGVKDRTVRLWDVAQKKAIKTWTSKERPVNGLIHFRPDSKSFVIATDNERGVVEFDEKADAPTWRPDAPKFSGACGISRDGRFALLSDGETLVRGYDLKDRQELGRVTLPTDVRGYIAVSADGRTGAAVGPRTGEIKGAPRIYLFRLGDPPPAEKVGVIRTYETAPLPIAAVCVSPDGRFIAAGGGAVLTSKGWAVGRDLDVRLLDRTTGAEVRRFKGPTNHIQAIVFSSDGKRLAAACSDNNGYVWDVASGKLVHTLAGHTRTVNGIAFLPDGKRLLTTSWDRTIRLWDAESGKEEAGQLGTAPGVATEWSSGVAFLPGGTQAIVSGWGRLVILDLQTDKVKLVFDWPGGRVEHLSLSPDGKRLLTAGADGTDMRARLWDVGTGKLLRTFTGVPGGRRVAWLPDGRRFLMACANDVCLADADTGALLQTFQGHKDEVMALAPVPHEPYAVSGSLDLTVRLWRLPDPPPPPAEKVGEIWRVPTPGFDCFHVQFSPDGRRFLLGGGDKTNSVLIGDTASGATLRTFGQGHLDGVFTPDNRMVLTFHGPGALKLWDVADGKEIRRFEGQPDGYAEADISPDGSRIVSGGADGKVRIWDLSTGKALFVMDAHTPVRPGAILCGAKFTHDGRQAISYCGGDPVIRIWDPQTGKLVRELEGQERGWRVLGTLPGDRIVTFRTTLRMGAGAAVRDLRTGKELLRIPLGETDGFGPHALLPDGRLLTAHTDRTLRLWSLDTGKEVGRVTVEDVNRTAFRVLTVSADGRHALVASHGRLVHLLRLPDPPPAEKVGQVHVFEGHKDIVQGIAVSADGHYAVSGGGYKFRDGKYVDGAKDFDIRVWDLTKRTEVGRLPGTGAPVWSVALTWDGKRVLCGGGCPDGALRLLEVGTGKELWHGEGHETAVWSVALDLHDRFVDAADGDNMFRLRNIDDQPGLKFMPFGGHTKPVRRAVISDDGRFVASASYDGTARLWNLGNNQLVHTFKTDKTSGWVRAVVISHDNRRVLTAGDDRLVHLWDVDTGKELKQLKGHKALINSVAISPDGRFALSGGGGLNAEDEEDFSIRLWDLEAGKELHRFDGHKDVVSQVIWLPDGKHALSSSWDTTVRLWRLPDLAGK